MKKIAIGNLAHVDAGKTSLTEAMLYECKAIRQLGRVDKKDTFLDTSYLEKNRGITIFSKQAKFSFNNTEFTLIDTPGHVDFSAEMERALRVIDYAVLVVSGSEGIQSHTRTLWKLLARYNIPTFIFVNKMDHCLANKEDVLNKLRSEFSTGIVDFTVDTNESWYESLALTEATLDEFLENGSISEQSICDLIANRNVFPVYFGSALKNYGVRELIEALDKYTLCPENSETLSGYVYKISRDEQGNRLTHIKITGGCIKVKDTIGEEKINQIRIYSGQRYETINEAHAQDICAITGCNETYAGMVIGENKTLLEEWTMPVLNYKLVATDDTLPHVLYEKIKVLEEEEPTLNVGFDEHLKEISIEVCGVVQMEILKSQMKDRFGIDIGFGKGQILYKETIGSSALGVGHFEPLRHYAEVHVMLEPGERGSGIVIENRCSEDLLEKSWQNTVLSCLRRKRHKGVSIGYPLTDVKITLVAGRAHKKHTEGGDFYKASQRAVRQGLMQVESIILEPYYEFVLEIPNSNVGRAITDIENMRGQYNIGNTSIDGITTITGKAPVATMCDYQSEVVAYTKGEGSVLFSPAGYDECHNPKEVFEAIGYDPLSDIANTPDSVFCANGAGYTVSYKDVFEYMHVEDIRKPTRTEKVIEPVENIYYEEEYIGTEEIDAILEKTFYANKRGLSRPKNGVIRRKIEDMNIHSRQIRNVENLPKYLLVDGYNIIYAWEELKELAKVNFDSARGRLLDILCNYQAMKKCNLIVVFDAYKVKGHNTEVLEYNNITVVYTKEAQTADRYIENFAHENSRKYDVTVATSDGVEQIIIRGAGASLYSAREFEEEVKNMEQAFREKYMVK